MTEREMEDLIAGYPDDFFPHKGFRLKGRQQSFAGVGRFDLLFTDRFDTNILMELKAVPAKYEVATQLARYRDELLARGEKHILMWLVAPSISNSVREFLDRIGIEYNEIHEAEFRIVAGRYGVASGVEPITHQPILNTQPGVTKSPREQPLRTIVASDGTQIASRMIYESFKDLMELAILPQQATNPDHTRLDGEKMGPNGKAAFRFWHSGKAWQVNSDTQYEPLKLAYDLIKNGESENPFIEEPTNTGKGTRLRLRQGSKNMFIYLLPNRKRRE